MVDQFLQAWTAAGGRGWRVTDPAAAVDDILRAEGARRVIRYATPACAALGLERLPGLCVAAWGPDRRAFAAAADAGVADAPRAAAATGTLVLPASPERGRLVTLLPPVCIFLVPAAGLRPTLAEALGDEVTVHLVSGPSRSGDIEGELVLGVHGPGRVYALVV
jgi:L-lactate utilization protein LutC